MNSNPQQQFWDWVENNIADALGYPVFSIGQEVLFERFGQIVVGEIESYVIGVEEGGETSLQYWLCFDGKIWGNCYSHEELLKLNPIANNLPRSRMYYDRQNPTNCNGTRD
ncbi:MAG: hypothetical protein WAN66_23805, partial [Limnoraphis robusta]|uniref:Uncharacterized protein n=1 Tax=Limnoraphis robusta CS-951 TaxID=1637645 RepID=A0A0J9HM02_9CYAN|nr:hypothetical protein [Limnoraphis robusta]KMW70234.1 hypothetical protein WN50_36710 [Limnoraphis robusta CS-951]